MHVRCTNETLSFYSLRKVIGIENEPNEQYFTEGKKHRGQDADSPHLGATKWSEQALEPAGQFRLFARRFIYLNLIV